MEITPPNSGTLSLTRNDAGQVTGISAASRSLTVSGALGYNDEGKLSSVSQTVGDMTRSASITYDLAGKIKTISYPAGFTVTYEYNGDGKVTAIKKGTTTLASYTYDTAGRLSTRNLSSGVVTTYTYDGMDRTDSITVSNGSTILWAERYGYNAAGQRIYTLAGTTGTVGDAYSLDEISQVKGIKYGATGADGGYTSASSPVGTATWSYDAAGNRETQVVGSSTTSYTANDVNQYTTVSSSTPVYNSRGDLAGYGGWAYVYDAMGNLIEAHNTSTDSLAKYWPDAWGLRAVKDVNGSKTIFFNLGPIQLETYDVAGSAASSTICEPGVDKPLAEINNSGDMIFYHQDYLGNVVLLTNSGGGIVEKYSYDAWGKVAATDGLDATVATTSIVSRLLYTAREFDKETGLYYYRNRGYSAELGRFLQNDPIDFAGGDCNLVRYVYNNPENFNDPWGFRYFSPCEVQAIIQQGIDHINDITDSEPGGDVLQGLYALEDLNGPFGTQDFLNEGDTFNLNGQLVNSQYMRNYLAGFNGEVAFGYAGQAGVNVAGAFFNGIHWITGATNLMGNNNAINAGARDARSQGY